MPLSIITRGYICKKDEGVIPVRIVYPFKLKFKNKRQFKIFLKKCSS